MHILFWQVIRCGLRRHWRSWCIWRLWTLCNPRQRRSADVLIRIKNFILLIFFHDFHDQIVLNSIFWAKFSSMISTRIPLIFEAAYCSTLNCTENTSLRSLFSFKLMLPLRVGAVPETSFPTSHFNRFSKESKLYDPSEAFRLTFVTQAGILQVTTTFVTGFGLTKRYFKLCNFETLDVYLWRNRNINLSSLQWGICPNIKRKGSGSIYWWLNIMFEFWYLLTWFNKLDIWEARIDHLAGWKRASFPRSSAWVEYRDENLRCWILLDSAMKDLTPSKKKRLKRSSVPEVWCSRKLDARIDPAIWKWKQVRALFVDNHVQLKFMKKSLENAIYIFFHVKVSLVVIVFDIRFSPRHIRQLARWQVFRYVALSS